MSGFLHGHYHAVDGNSPPFFFDEMIEAAHAHGKQNRKYAKGDAELEQGVSTLIVAGVVAGAHEQILLRDASPVFLRGARLYAIRLCRLFV